MTKRTPELPVQTRDVVSYEDDVHAWMYLDQIDGVLRYEAFVIGYDDSGSPTTLEIVIEEGAFPLTDFPQLMAILPKSIRERAQRNSQGPDALAQLTSPPGRASGGFVPWELTARQWERLHRFCEEQERRMKREYRFRWTRRLRALGYDVIQKL